MNDLRSNQSCLHCGASDQEKPLVELRFCGKALHVCPQCLPILIHHPDMLADKLLLLMGARKNPRKQ